MGSSFWKKNIKQRLLLLLSFLSLACNGKPLPEREDKKEINAVQTDSVPMITEEITERASTISIPMARSFSFPFGNKQAYTTKNDGDGWYSRQNLHTNRHLGEDWNLEAGNDCGQPIYAIADGLVIYSENPNATWGNVVIIRHLLPDGSQIESLYAHLENRDKIAYGTAVAGGQLIGRLGDGGDPCGDGSPYGAHLHLELRTPTAKHWGSVGTGYSTETEGVLAPTAFIRARL